jgi:hypothetical protein
MDANNFLQHGRNLSTASRTWKRRNLLEIELGSVKTTNMECYLSLWC